ncbi:MAG: hypothetical protein ACRCSK_06110 [Fusobacteriaceae bacterium]
MANIIVVIMMITVSFTIAFYGDGLMKTSTSTSSMPKNISEYFSIMGKVIREQLTPINILYSIVQSILSFILIYGFAKVLLEISKTKKIKLSDIFYGFTKIWTSIKICFRFYFFTSLWALLFIVPGIIKSISYSFCFFIQLENEKLSAKEAIEKSKRLTDGIKGKIVKFNFYMLGPIFIGFFILTILPRFIIPHNQQIITGFSAVLMLLSFIFSIILVILGIRYSIICYVGIANIYHQAKKEKQNENS